VEVSPRKKKTATLSGGHLRKPAALDRADLRRLRAFGALGDGELYALTFLQRLEARRLNLREVSEKILATTLRGDETEAFGLVEPLNRTLCHLKTSLKRKKNNLRGQESLRRANDQVRKPGNKAWSVVEETSTGSQWTNDTQTKAREAYAYVESLSSAICWAEGKRRGAAA
jgi:hypothetical protein